MFRRVLAALCLVAAIAAPAAAQQIGQTVTVQNQVTGEVNSVVRRLAVGDGVATQERVSTATSSTTLLRFLDQTQLNIGASSTVVLDRFVYNPGGDARDAAINLTKGAMRFVTGNSNPASFTIKTQVATIGIRGTDFAVICNGAGRCAVVVDKGIVGVCPGVYDRFSPSCRGYCQLNETDNFTLVERGQTCSVQQVSRATVQAAMQAIAAGRVIDLASIGVQPGGPIQFAAAPGVAPIVLEGLAFVSVGFAMAVGVYADDNDDSPITP